MGRVIIPLFIVLMSSACSPIASLYGVSKPKTLKEKKIVRVAKRLEIPTDALFEMDTTFFTLLTSLKTEKTKNQIKNHYQPLQAIYFSRADTMSSFQVNCYAGGFPNLEWNRGGVLATFPPKKQAPLDTLVTLTNQLTHIKPLMNSSFFETNDFDYVAVICWSKFMGRQNRRFIKVIHENRLLSQDAKVKYVYVNMDNAFTWSNLW